MDKEVAEAMHTVQELQGQLAALSGSGLDLHKALGVTGSISALLMQLQGALSSATAASAMPSASAASCRTMPCSSALLTT